MYYSITPNNFEAQEVLQYISRCRNRGTKEWFLYADNARRLPDFLKYLNYYLFTKDLGFFIPSHERIIRSTNIEYYFSLLTNGTKPITLDDTEYSSPFKCPLQALDTFNFKSLYGIHIIPVDGQIQYTFETKIPAWAREVEATENLAVSLILKLTPKHRVRVYKRNNHIIVFTTKGISDAVELDWKLYRTLWACLPLLCDWVSPDNDTEFPDVVELCKALGNDDATTFWTLLNNAYKNSPTIIDLKYSSIIQAFNNINAIRTTQLTRQIDRHNSEATQLLQDYARILEAKRDLERRLLEIQNRGTSIDATTVRQLVDKRVCYQLDTAALTNNDGTLTYRCAAPLLSYDKDAARTFYNRRVKADCSLNTQRLFKLLFIDEQVILNFDEAIDVRLNRGTYTAQIGCTNGYNDPSICLPNPHHNYFNCWGSYGPILTKLIHEFKLEELFYQIKAAIGSINFSDPPVMRHFINDLQAIADERYTPACFYWRDENCTTLHTAKETLEHFIEEETE